MTDNKMQEILIDKVTVNIGVGSPGERLDFAKELIKRLTARTPVETLAKRREPVFKLRKGLPIGAKVTLRNAVAREFLEKALSARRRTLSSHNFDKTGNFAFGVAEYIDFPGAKYDPAMGMFGFDVAVTLARRGRRVAYRKIMPAVIGAKHRITKEQAMDFARSVLNVKVE
jgi:large subunit ribosomal protein L5